MLKTFNVRAMYVEIHNMLKTHTMPLLHTCHPKAQVADDAWRSPWPPCTKHFFKPLAEDNEAFENATTTLAALEAQNLSAPLPEFAPGFSVIMWFGAGAGENLFVKLKGLIADLINMLRAKALFDANRAVHDADHHQDVQCARHQRGGVPFHASCRTTGTVVYVGGDALDTEPIYDASLVFVVLLLKFVGRYLSSS